MEAHKKEISEEHRLRCGKIDLIYENSAIRKIKIGQTEILRMVYPAIRDCNWRTVQSRIIHEVIEQTEDGFKIKLGAEYIQDDINFYANYLIQGFHNQISFEMYGKANSTFLKNRIGICVLNPIKECAGKTGSVLHGDDLVENFIFPKYISQYQPLKDIKQIKWEPENEIFVRLDFYGDIFEMEDQRNWTDASYKIYSTPLEYPFPVEVKRGEELSQKIVLSVDSKTLNEPNIKDTISFNWDPGLTIKLPELGLGVSTGNKIISKEEIKLFSNIKLQHLRADIHMDKNDWQNEIQRAVTEAGLLKVPLFFCVYLSNDYQNMMEAFLDYFKNRQKLLKAILCVGLNHLPHPFFNTIAKRIRQQFPKVNVGTGVNAHFAELNRNRPDVSVADFVSFSVSPQVHANDEKSIIENLEGLAEVVKMAHILFPEKPIWVSPITLKQRCNVVATQEKTYTGPEKLAPQVDLRQQTMFAATWTLGAFKQLSQFKTDLIDFYETIGWKGIIQNISDSSLSGLSSVNALKIYPLFYLFRVLSNVNYLFSSVSSHPDLVDGLVFKKDGITEIILTNYSKENQNIILPIKTRNIQVYSLTEYPDNPKNLSEVDILMLHSNDIMIIRP